MGINLRVSANWFKLINKILNIMGKIILCEVSVLHKLHMLDDSLIPRAFCLFDIEQAQGTNSTASNPEAANRGVL